MSAVLVRNDGATVTDLLVLDAVPTYTVAPAATITAHPVERGTQITDNRQPLQTPVTLRARVTETPEPGQESWLPVGPARVQAVLDWLDASGDQLLTLYVPERPTVRDLLIESYAEGFDQYRGMDLSITLRQVVIVDTAIVTLPTMVRPRAVVKAANSPESDAGDATGGGVTDANGQTDESVARAGLGYVLRLMNGGP